MLTDPALLVPERGGRADAGGAKRWYERCEQSSSRADGGDSGEYG